METTDILKSCKSSHKKVLAVQKQICRKNWYDEECKQLVEETETRKNLY